MNSGGKQFIPWYWLFKEASKSETSSEHFKLIAAEHNSVLTNSGSVFQWLNNSEKGMTFLQSTVALHDKWSSLFLK